MDQHMQKHFLVPNLKNKEKNLSETNEKFIFPTSLESTIKQVVVKRVILVLQRHQPV